ncbi:MAG TPA: glycosyltransferase family 39 protein [Tepidisphaeraceae bacterium]|nr:glycosyltransferase family 39 protein [Tepidisphaeraceae bacterium]
MHSLSRRQSVSAFELISIFVALAAVALLQLTVTRCFDLFYHPLWLDEVFTSRMANDPSFAHLFRALAHGFDTNPPTLYLMLWPIARMLDVIDNSHLRLFAMLWMLFGMTGLYAICRRFFTRGPCIVAVLAVWAHPLIIDQGFEARFYAPWLALTVWFCYLQMLATDDEPKPRLIARYVLGILATAIHYFGAIAMFMIAAADFLIHRKIKRIIPSLLGMLAIIACLPLMRGQRANLSIPTWIEPSTASDIRDDIVAIFGAPSFILVLLLMWSASLLRGRETSDHQPRGDLRELLPMSSLILLPLALIVFSKVIQPALVLRYLILAIVPMAPMFASLIQRSGRLAINMAILSLIALGAITIINKSHATRGLDTEFATAIAEIDRRVPPDGLIIFKRRREMYPILQIRPDLASRSAQLDFDDAVLPNVSRMSQYERDMGRKGQEIYSDLKMMKTDELSKLSRFFVVTPIDEYKELQLELPGFDISDPDGVLHVVKTR